jgi:glycosyltransferase involved in cell wall biosynthesis
MLHGYYVNEFKLLRFLKQNHIKTIYSMIDEYPYMGKCTNSFGCNKFETKCYHCPQIRDYPKSLLFDRSAKIFEMKKEAYRGFRNIIFTGPQWVLDRAKKSSLIWNMNFANIDEFTDLENVFYPREISGLRNKLGISRDKKIVLNVGPFVYPRKGGIYFLNIAKLLEKENIIFIHVGYDGKTDKLPANFIPVDYVRDQDKLAEYYSIADLLVCTSLADTMPNVCIEALSCGTPICGFNVDGISFISTPEFGTFVPVFDILSLSLVIKSAPYKTRERSLACRTYSEMRYSKQLFFSKVLKLYSDS